MNLFDQEELKEWDQCLLMLGDGKFDEHGNVYDTKDNSAMYLDKDGEDREINVKDLILLLFSVLQFYICKFQSTISVLFGY